MAVKHKNYFNLLWFFFSCFVLMELLKIISDKQDEGEESVVGKMRKFQFLDVRNKKKMNLDTLPQADFSTPDFSKFHQQLDESLDKFVVRREIVVSDQTTFYNTTTSVTFTKTSCFQHNQRYVHSPE